MDYSYNITNFNPGYYVQSTAQFVGDHKPSFATILCAIPILIIMIWGFVMKQNKLGFTCIGLLLTVAILGGVFAFKTGQARHIILLICIIIIEVGFIIYFLTQIKAPISNDDYVDFYGKDDNPKGGGIPMSYYGIDVRNKEALKSMMDGQTYGYAMKEKLPMDLGTEFTYSFWLRICPVNFNKMNSTWRTVWYRGNNTGKDGQSIYKRKTPGVYLAPNTNKMIITVACENGPDEGNAIIIDDVPINEWFCVTVVLEGRSLDCYINGLLEQSISLTGAPLMMNSNIWKGTNGFNGMMAFFRYSSGALFPQDVKNLYERERQAIKTSDYDLTCNN